jgi:hypothetical protein
VRNTQKHDPSNRVAARRALIRRANRTEKPEVERLLKLLCDTLPEREYAGVGAKPIPLKDIVYCLVYRVYALWATQRSASTFAELLKKGLISRVPKESCLHQFGNEEEVLSLINGLIGRMCAPLIFIDNVYSVDATHFIQEHFLPYR